MKTFIVCTLGAVALSACALPARTPPASAGPMQPEERCMQDMIRHRDRMAMPARSGASAPQGSPEEGMGCMGAQGD